MAAQDDLLAHTPEIQDALRHSLQESGAAGTGPVALPPPADFTSEQSHGPASADPLSYSNTLTVQLYRDAEGKVWTQPGPGHDSSDLEMRIRKVKGTWHVVTEVSHVVSTVKSKGHTYTTIRTDAISTSGAPTDYELPSDQGHAWNETDRAGRPVTPSAVRNSMRFEDFSPLDAKTAMRQAITKLQQKGAIYAPTVPGPSGNASNALFAAAAIAALAAAAALAGIGPFATQAAAAPPAASAAPTAVPSAAKTVAAPVKLTGSGSIAFALPARYGTSPTVTDYLCQNTFLPPPSGATAEEPAMGMRGLLNGRTYTAFFSATRTQVIFENVSATPAMFGPAPSTFILGQRAAGTIAIQTGPQTNPAQSGTVTVDLTCAGGAAVPAPSVTAVSVTAVSAPVIVSTTPAPLNGPSPWGPALAALAVVLAGAGAATKKGIGPLAGAAAGLSDSSERKAPPSCDLLLAAREELRAIADRHSGKPGGDEWLDDRRLDLQRIEEALARCQTGHGPDVVPMRRGRSSTPGLDRLGVALHMRDDKGGFQPTPPPSDGDDDADERKPIE